MQTGQFARIAQNYAGRVSDFVRKLLLPSTASLARDTTDAHATGRAVRLVAGVPYGVVPVVALPINRQKSNFFRINLRETFACAVAQNATAA
jgi:hypothetical protein